MSNLPISSKYRSTPNLPVSDAEREHLAARLNAAFSDGLIDSDTYRAHLDHLFAAGTLGELVPVVESLPPAPTHDQPAVVVQSSTVEPGALVPSRPMNMKLVAMVAGGLVAVVVVIVLLLTFLI